MQTALNQKRGCTFTSEIARTLLNVSLAFVNVIKCWNLHPGLIIKCALKALFAMEKSLFFSFKAVQVVVSVHVGELHLLIHTRLN